VLVSVKNMADQRTPGASQLLAPNLEKFTKFLLRSRGNGKRHKFISTGLGHENILKVSRPVK
jgi:hypothetical protein